MGPGYLGWGGMWGFPMSIFVIILVAVFLVVGWWCFGGPWRRYPGAYDHKYREMETPLEILERRYAKGEIAKQEFEQIKKDLSL
jgi:putative membrane protein